jgi:hypothetical protein
VDDLTLTVNYIHERIQRGGACSPAAPKQNLKYTAFVDMMTSQVLRNLRFNQNQPLK